MIEQRLEDRIAQRVIARMLPYMQGANGPGIKPQPQPRLLDTKAAAAYLGISESALRHLKHRGLIPFVKIGKRRIMYGRAELDRWTSPNRRLV